MFEFEELTEQTRNRMLKEFRAEQESVTVPPYRPHNMTPSGIEALLPTMEWAISEANEEALANELNNPEYWEPFDIRHSKKGKLFTYSIDPAVAARALAITEFNTWYVRGLGGILLDEEAEFCEVYRAAPAYNPRPECLRLEGIVTTQEVYDGHRARYHPQRNDSAFSIPFGTNCHHSIRRT